MFGIDGSGTTNSDSRHIESTFGGFFQQDADGIPEIFRELRFVISARFNFDFFERLRFRVQQREEGLRSSDVDTNERLFFCLLRHQIQETAGA